MTFPVFIMHLNYQVAHKNIVFHKPCGFIDVMEDDGICLWVLVKVPSTQSHSAAQYANGWQIAIGRNLSMGVVTL